MNSTDNSQEQQSMRLETNLNMSLFNLTKIYEQIDFNEDLKNSIKVTKGSFQWENGHQDTKVIFVPNKDGRFLVTWVPPEQLQNKRYIKNGTNYPGNEHCGAFGCDPYDISGHYRWQRIQWLSSWFNKVFNGRCAT